MGGIWEVEYIDDFERWWAVGIHGSRHPPMRGLRIQAQGRPLRVLYAFDTRRVAILLLGGDKTGDDRWYDWAVAAADLLYDEHVNNPSG